MTTRCGFVALVGAPNAGKSTLLNTLVGSKVSIVTPKVQTTRTRILGIASEEQTQLIYVDTPGIFEPRRRLDRAMVAAAWQGSSDADKVMLLIDANQKKIDANSLTIIEGLKKSQRPTMLVLNKVDLVDHLRLLPLTQKLSEMMDFEQIFMISATTGNGVDSIRKYLERSAPEGPWLYPDDQLADMTERLLAAEITRETLYIRLHSELPYASTVETEKWTDQPDGSVRIDQVIFVQRDTQKAIVLGNRGSMIKKLGQEARLALEEALDRRVHLFLFVKVRENWQDDPERYREMGLDYQS